MKEGRLEEWKRHRASTLPLQDDPMKQAEQAERSCPPHGSCPVPVVSHAHSPHPLASSVQQPLSVELFLDCFFIPRLDFFLIFFFK